MLMMVFRMRAAGKLFIHIVSRPRSEEHTSELQSQSNLVCRLLLEKKKKHSISRALAPLPDDRSPTMTEFSTALRAFPHRQSLPTLAAFASRPGRSEAATLPFVLA